MMRLQEGWMRKLRLAPRCFRPHFWFFVAGGLVVLAVSLPNGPIHAQNMSLNGMVVSPHPMAAQAGLRILQQGGNAFDAAVATAAVAGVVDRLANGSFGGVGGYALIYDRKTQRVRALDYIGTAPAAATIERFTEGSRLWDTAQPVRDSFMAPIVPGNLAGLAALLEGYGTMSWTQVLAPAIEYAEQGVVVIPRLNRAYAESAVARYPYGASIFFKEGKAWPVGEVLKQPDLAKTLRSIANGGPKVLYGGELAEKFAAYFQENGGILTVKDFADYRALWRDPLVTSYRGYTVYSHPPGSGGMTVLQTLNTLERFDVAATGHNTPEFIHLVTEALKLSFIDDDAFNTGKDYAQIPLDRLLSKEYAANQAARIDRTKAQFYPPARLGSRTSNHTINHTVVDKDRNVVTMTQTSMQSMVVVPETGVAFNSGMSYFSLDPADVNRIEGSQRPRFVMSPSIVMRYGEPYVALGAGGGWTIPQTILQVLVRFLDFGMDAHDAVKAPRFTLSYLGNSIPYLPGTDLVLEREVPVEVESALRAMGHRLRSRDDRSTNMLNAIQIYSRSGALSAGADPREAHAAGW
jgi:gamma-glutamyltranspeptidase/glutathione hydrolase